MDTIAFSGTVPEYESRAGGTLSEEIRTRIYAVLACVAVSGTGDVSVAIKDGIDYLKTLKPDYFTEELCADIAYPSAGNGSVMPASITQWLKALKKLSRGKDFDATKVCGGTSVPLMEALLKHRDLVAAGKEAIFANIWASQAHGIDTNLEQVSVNIPMLTTTEDQGSFGDYSNMQVVQLLRLKKGKEATRFEKVLLVLQKIGFAATRHVDLTSTMFGQKISASVKNHFVFSLLPFVIQYVSALAASIKYQQYEMSIKKKLEGQPADEIQKVIDATNCTDSFAAQTIAFTDAPPTLKIAKQLWCSEQAVFNAIPADVLKVDWVWDKAEILPTAEYNRVVNAANIVSCYGRTGSLVTGAAFTLEKLNVQAFRIIQAKKQSFAKLVRASADLSELQTGLKNL